MGLFSRKIIKESIVIDQQTDQELARLFQEIESYGKLSRDIFTRIANIQEQIEGLSSFRTKLALQIKKTQNSADKKVLNANIEITDEKLQKLEEEELVDLIKYGKYLRRLEEDTKKIEVIVSGQKKLTEEERGLLIRAIKDGRNVQVQTIVGRFFGRM